jgi:hypothetical protein
VGAQKTHGFFYFLDKDSLNVFNTFYIKSPGHYPGSQGMPMDNVGAPAGAV